MESIRYLLKLSSLVEGYRSELKSGNRALSLDVVLVSYINDILEKGIETYPVSDKDKTCIRNFFLFLNTVPKIHLSQRSVDTYIGVLNLSPFKKLKSLTLTKIDVDRLNGFGSLQTRLESLICNRCTHPLCLFQDDSIWPDLRVLILSYCHLDNFEFNPFKNTLRLRHLSLSYNKLTFVPGLEALDNLEHLDLSFNRLKKIPRLSSKASKKLNILLVSGNQISSLIGLRNIVNLTGLDLSFNCLLRKYDLKDVFYLKSLLWVNLSNNPVSFVGDYRLYVLQNLGTTASSSNFILDRVSLNPVEKSIFGIYNKTLKEDETFSYLSRREGRKTSQQSNRTKKKAREVIIEETPDDNDEDDRTLRVLIHEEPVVEEHLETKKQVETLRQKFGKDNWLHSQSGEVVQDLMGLKKSEQPSAYEVPHYDLVTKASLIHNPYNGNFTTSTPKKSEQLDPDSGPSKIFTVVEVLPPPESDDDEEIATILETEDPVVPPPTTSEEESSEFVEATLSTNPSSEDTFFLASEEVEESESLKEENLIDEDEILWIAQKVDPVTNLTETLFLVLSENELKERSTSSGLTKTSWSLSTVISCVKVKNDPLTLEIEFDSLKKDKQLRTYIMEFPDAQVLMGKISSILESRPLSALNQSTYKCMKCSSLFSNFVGTKTKSVGVSCQICGSTLVVEMEEPRLPTNNSKPQSDKVLSDSPSESSIAFTLENGCGTSGSGLEKLSSASTSCSAASLDHSGQSVKLNETHTPPRRCESDVEIISNPSQSSIEVLDDPHRNSGATTPGRKRSHEERLTVAAVPQLGTVPEVLSNFPALTESSSSGSLTESVVTAYESHTNVGKKINTENSVLEEGEESPNESTLIKILDTTIVSTDATDEESSIVPEVEDSVYSFTDFADIDHRVKLYLYSSVLESDDEHPLCLAKGHLWKTGGSDFEGCVVFTPKSVYFIAETSSEYGDDASQWLSKMECYKIKEIKLYPLIWNQGLGIQIRNIHYLLLFQDRMRTENFISYLRGLPVKIKMQKSPNSKPELALQRLAVECNVDQKSLDPTVNFFTIFSQVAIYSDDVCHDIMRLVGLIVTTSELHIVVGDLGWLTASSSCPPSVHSSQIISSLIEVEKVKTTLSLHFDEPNRPNADEETWCLTQVTEEELDAVICAIRTPWEQLFSTPLQVTIKN